MSVVQLTWVMGSARKRYLASLSRSASSARFRSVMSLMMAPKRAMHLSVQYGTSVFGDMIIACFVSILLRTAHTLGKGLLVVLNHGVCDVWRDSVSQGFPQQLIGGKEISETPVKTDSPRHGLL